MKTINNGMRMLSVLAWMLVFRELTAQGISTQPNEKFSDYFSFQSTIQLSVPSLAPLSSPCPCAVTTSGDLFIADKLSAVIRQYSNHTFVRSFGGKGAGPGEFRSIFSLAVDTSMLYILDPMARRMNRLTLAGRFLSSFPIPDGRDLRIASTGEIIIAAPLIESPTRSSCIQIYSSTGKLIRSFFPLEEIVLKNKMLADNVVLDIDSKNIIYACQESRYRIMKFDLSGNLLKVIEPTNKRFRPIPSKVFEDFYSKDAIRSWYESWDQVVVLHVIADKIILVALHTTRPRKFMIDIYAIEGKLLHSGIATDLRLLCTDSQGKVYFLKHAEKEHYGELTLEQYLLTPRLLSSRQKD